MRTIYPILGLAACAIVDTTYTTVLPPASYTIAPLVWTGTFTEVIPKAKPEFFKGDTSLTWVIHLEDGGKKLDVRYGNKVYRFRPKDGKINLDTTITEKQ